MSIFTGKVALVTGGSSGIGRAAAVAFASEGAKVVVASRRQQEGQETVELIRQAGSEGIFIQTDITKEEEVKAMVDKAIATYGKLDYAFNNAGVEGSLAPLVEQNLNEYNRVFDANVKGLFLSMKYEIASMLENGGGSIVNNSSIAGLIGFAGMGIYVASKHAVLGLTKTAALEVAKSNIRVNAVSPGGIQTDMFGRFASSHEGMEEQMIQLHPVGRLGKPEEIADAVVFLCSDRASFITGQSIAVDGGFTTQ
jgi:NAD(P)-dependent dehydrogenase (short-subunit alcohol dehydrogenase family)